VFLRNFERGRMLAGSKPKRRWHHRIISRAEPLEERHLLSNFSIANGDVAGLIAAIDAADSNGQDNTIALAERGSYVLSAVDNMADGPTGLPVISASDHTLTFRGQGATISRSTAAHTQAFRLFDIAAGASLQLQDLTLSNGLETGAAARGGAIYNEGTLALVDTVVEGNAAQGSAGVTGLPGVVGGTGGNAQGGGIYQAAGNLILGRGSLVTNNQAKGGDGGNGGTLTRTPTYHVTRGGPGGIGGNGMGGGIFVAGGNVTLLGHSVVSGNQATGGNGGNAGGTDHITGRSYFPHASPGGAAGNGAGGGIYQAAGVLSIRTGTLADNQAQGGAGGAGMNGTPANATSGMGGIGGSGAGGGLYAAGATLTLSHLDVASNDAIGGPGGQGASGHFFTGQTQFYSFGFPGNVGGDAEGGGLDLKSVTGTFSNTTFSSNSATGGDGGTGGAGTSGGNGGNGGNAIGGALGVDNSQISVTYATFSGNTAQGGNGGISLSFTIFDNQGGYGGNGGSASGGGLYSEDSTLALANVIVTGNGARGGAGGAGADSPQTSAFGSSSHYGGFGGSGGASAGGGIYLGSGSLTLSSVSLSDNVAQGGSGGAGGTGFSGGGGGVGGNAAGGGLYSAASSMTVADVTVATNTARGGAGGNGGNGFLVLSVSGSPGAGLWGGDGGSASGGGIAAVSSHLNATGATISGNVAQGGNGGEGGSGFIAFNGGNPYVPLQAIGGGALGGGLYLDGTITIEKMVVNSNVAQGGNGGAGGNGATAPASGSGQGGDGGNGGAADGGGIYLASGTMALTNCDITRNSAVAGSGGAAGIGVLNGTPGTDPQSIGGGLFNAGGSVSLTRTTVHDNSADIDPNKGP
jgi:hypothetical protein